MRLNGTFQLAVKKEYSSDVKAVLEIKKGASLSPAAMEVLTIAAYNQPVTKAFVEHVRGVDSSSVVNSLVEKDLLC
jgi:segregation and condensation protein B